MARVVPIDSHDTMEWRDARWQRRLVPLPRVYYFLTTHDDLAIHPSVTEVCRVVTRDRDRADQYWPLVEALYR